MPLPEYAHAVPSQLPYAGPPNRPGHDRWPGAVRAPCRSARAAWLPFAGRRLHGRRDRPASPAGTQPRRHVPVPRRWLVHERRRRQRRGHPGGRPVGNPQAGDLVIAIWDGNQPTCKVLQLFESHMELHSANPDFPIVLEQSTEVEVFAVVGVVRQIKRRSGRVRAR